MQRTIPGPITLTAGILQTLQQAGQHLEILETGKLLFFDFFSFNTHEWHLNTTPNHAQ